MLDRAEFMECRECRCRAARTEAQRLTRFYDDKLRPYGLTISQFSMLTALILAGSLPMSRLAELMDIERTTVSRNVALCQKAGLVSVGAGKDARERLVAITAEGRRSAEAALPAWRVAQAATKAAMQG